jgi:tetratricopeptide (TPR) repeat protein
VRRLKEANKVLAYAKIVYAHTAQEVYVLVAASQLYVEKGDFDSAIRMLDKISTDSPTYGRAQIIKADILLNHHHNKERFTKCYQQLAEREPTAKHFSMLGDAYLRILNPEAAVEALEKAGRLDPTNGRLRSRIGHALVATHEYHRAIEFYTTSIKNLSKLSSATRSGDRSALSDQCTLSIDLAKLFIKLDRSKSAVMVLNDVLVDRPSELADMQQNVAIHMLLFSVHESTDQMEAYKVLNDFAYPLQKDVVIKLRSGVGGMVSSTELVETAKTVLSDICYKIGNVLSALGEFRNAEEKVLTA